jgi:hypothetical protein
MGRNPSELAAFRLRTARRNFSQLFGVVEPTTVEEIIMGLGRGLLLWLIGIPLPIIIVIALLMHH